MDNTAEAALVNWTTPTCTHCGKASVRRITEVQAGALRSGRAHVQVIFPDFDADERELFITGTHPACWVAMFGAFDDEDDDLDDCPF